MPTENDSPQARVIANLEFAASVDEAGMFFKQATGHIMPGIDGCRRDEEGNLDPEVDREFKVWCAAIAYMKAGENGIQSLRRKLSESAERIRVLEADLAVMRLMHPEDPAPESIVSKDKDLVECLNQRGCSVSAGVFSGPCTGHAEEAATLILSMRAELDRAAVEQKRQYRLGYASALRDQANHHSARARHLAEAADRSEKSL